MTLNLDDFINPRVLKQHWSEFDCPQRREYFFSLPRVAAEELFAVLSAEDQVELIGHLPIEEKRSWLRYLAPDDAADFIQHCPQAMQEQLLNLLDLPTRREVAGLLAYAEDEAGGLMNSRFIRLRPDLRADEAIGYLRTQAKSEIETVYYTYVLEADQKLVGVVSFRELLLAPADKRVSEFMHKDIISAPEELDREELSRLFIHSHLMAIPVVDKNHHIKGIVTYDDIATAVQKEATEDIQKLGGMSALDAPYFKVTFLEMVKKRAGWLVILFVGEMFTATAMSYYEHEIARAVVLALFIPLIISSGGNSGSQASTLIIRSLGTREVRLRDWWKVMRRELASGLLLGGILGSLGFLRIVLWQQWHPLYGEHYILIALTVAVSLVGIVMWGVLSGSMLPFILRKLGFDPATASAPFVATLVDVTGLIIYFTVASILLRGTLL